MAHSLLAFLERETGGEALKMLTFLKRETGWNIVLSRAIRKTVFWSYVDSESADQIAHPHNLI